MLETFTNWWPLCVALSYLIVCAWFQWATDQVPNLLTGVSLLSGLFVSGLVQSGSLAGHGGFVSSITAGLISFALLLFFYSAGWLGAGCVKSQATFGVWLGCMLPVGAAALLATAATLCSILITGLLVFAWSKAKPQASLFPAQVSLSACDIVTVLVMIGTVAKLS